MADEMLASRAQAWFCTTGLPSDVIIEVDGMTFHLHKFPLMLKSRKLHDLLSIEPEHKDDQKEIEEDGICRISLPDFPASSSAFESAAKFCYGVRIDFSSSTVAPIRCAAEHLDMTEDFSENNLIQRADQFISQSVLCSLPQSVKTLKSCESLLPIAENLGIAQRCIDSIAVVALSNRRGIKGTTEELTNLSLPFFKRVISAIKERSPPDAEIVEESLVSYAIRIIPGLSRSKRNLKTAPPFPSDPDQLDLLETLIANLSPESQSSGRIRTQFLSGLLRTANILRAPERIKTALERKIAAQLDQATLDDLLMPSYSYLAEMLYDVEAVERILRCYMEGASLEATEIMVRSPDGIASAEEDDGLLKVGRLVDGFLAEVASDANLRVEKFCGIALMLPENARVYHDGLYRAVDVFLKAHPSLPENEKEKVSGVMDFRKLTLEACTHAAQNERLPLRAVVQVLFFEQLQLRQAVAGAIIPSAEDDQPLAPSPARESQLLRLGMDSMRSRVQDLEQECSSMRRAIERIDRTGLVFAGGRPGPAKKWGFFAGKLGCKSRTQVFNLDAVGRPKRSSF